MLPWDAVRTSGDPHATILRFADAVYGAAVDLGDWPRDLAEARTGSWEATRRPVFAPED